MSALSKLKPKVNLQVLSNESLSHIKKIDKIKKSLLDLEKEEVASFIPLKVKVYKDEEEGRKEDKKTDKKNENKIKIPIMFKTFFENYKRYKGFINQIESGIVIPTTGTDSVQVEQNNSSDLVNSD